MLMVANDSIADRVYDELRARILAGHLARGERLRQELLAADLGVSRTPLREALRRLATEGLVTLESHRGARVVAPTPDAQRDSYEARLLIEPGAARLAAERAAPAAIAAMRTAIADQRAAGPRLEPAFQANRAFHLAVVAGASNPQLDRIAGSLWLAGLGFFILERQQLDGDRLLREVEDHERIADAIEAHDGDRAARLTSDHIDRSFRSFVAGASER